MTVKQKYKPFIMTNCIFCDINFYFLCNTKKIIISKCSLKILFSMGWTDEVRDQFAWISPLLGDISPACLISSNRYIDELEFIINSTMTSPSKTDNDDLPGIPESIVRFDANGRLPMEGSLADVMEIPIELCFGILNGTWPECQYVVPPSLRMIKLKIPIGYSYNPGSYEECLGTDSSYATVLIQGPYIPGLSDGGFGRAAKTAPTLENIANVGKKFATLRQWKSLEVEHTIDFMDKQSLDPYVGVLKGFKGYNSSIEEIQEAVLLVGLGVYSIINQPRIGMCFPKECTADDINANYRFLTENKSIVFNGISYVKSDDFVSISTNVAYTNDNRTGMPEDYPASILFFFVLFSIIGVFIVSGTAFDFWIVMSGNSMEDLAKQNSILTFCMKFLMCFSAYTNGKRLLSTESGGKDHLDCLNGIRFISMTWVVIGHSFFAIMSGAMRNMAILGDVFAGKEGLGFDAILNAVPSVDSFFLMSGCLTTFILLKELEKAGSNITKHFITMVMYYVHRYLRITMTYILLIGVTIAVLPYIYYGPGWWAVVKESEDCRKYFWAHILYVNTLIDYTKGEENYCMGVTWYLVDDMIFHFFSPVVIYPMYFAYRMTKKHIVGLVWWTFTLACFTFGVFYISYTSRQPPGILTFPNLETDLDYHDNFYDAPWTRYQAYLIGIVLGYVLHHTRGKQIEINQVLNILAWQVAFLAAFAVVYGLHDAIVAGTITLFAATVYNTFQRIAWNGALAWVIFSCTKGYGGIVNEFLSWSAFVPLSKLTFTTYLIHFQIETMFSSYVLASFPNDWSIWANVWIVLPQILVSLSAGFILALVFESPCIRVERLVVGKILQFFMPPNKQLPTVQTTKEDIPAAKLEEHAQENHENGGPNEKERMSEANYVQSPVDENIKIDVVMDSELPYRPPNYEDVIKNDSTVEN